MNKSQRIYLNTGDTGNQNQDKYIKVKLEQNIETLEFMTISLGTEDIYQNFNSDYGVLVGRVIANGGIGIPNARISIFIPLTDEDADNDNIYNIYPYKTPRDKNNDGKRYNLLPRVAKKDPKTGIVTPKQPFGSFPIKEEILGNPSFLSVYKKYYKYTALTNNSGDYMIFGVPVGTQTVHLSVDITDIGKYSMTPAAMVTNLGYSPNLFTDGGSRIKPSDDLNDLPNIETQEISVDVRPFWGDVENFEIGITRQDFRIRSVLANTFVIFGSVFTDGSDSMWGGDSPDFTDEKISELYHIRNNEHRNMGMVSKRIGKVTEKIYYYPASITDEKINSGNVDPKTEMLLLDPSEYSIYKRDGDFVFIINCNRNRIITDDFGNEIPVDENSSFGVHTKFRGFIILEISPDDVPMNFEGKIGNKTEIRPFRYRLKFPQYSREGRGLQRETDSEKIEDVQNWRRQHYVFSGGEFYSIAQFNGIVHMYTDNNNDANYLTGENNCWSKEDDINDPFSTTATWSVGILQTNDNDGVTGNTQFGMVSNVTKSGNIEYFGANWLNFTSYLPQVAFAYNEYTKIEDWRSTTHFTQNFKSSFFFGDNSQIIAGNDFNTKFMARSDLHWTDIIHVPVEDIEKIRQYPNKGFTSTQLPSLSNNYRNGWYVPDPSRPACPLKGGRLNGDAQSPVPDPKTYFYKGFDTADCIEYLYLLGLI